MHRYIICLFSNGIIVSGLYLIKVGEIFPQESAYLYGAALISVKGSCLLLLNIPKYYSIHWVIYMLMQKVTFAYRPFDAAP